MSVKRQARIRNAPVIETLDRRYIYDRDGERCHICGERVVLGIDATLDHLVPLSKGGNHTADNVRLAHRSCNSRRGAGRLPAQLILVG